MVAEGFTIVKFEPDVPTPYASDPYGSCHCHWRYNVHDALRLARALEPYDLLGLEDPVLPENPEAMRRVAQGTRTPIASGENFYLRHGFRTLLEQAALSILAPDIPKVGGLAKARRMADLAEMYDVAVAPHSILSPLGTVASCICVPPSQTFWPWSSMPTTSVLRRFDHRDALAPHPRRFHGGTGRLGAGR